MKEGFKETEVGVIPGDWVVKAIDELSEVKSGKRLPLGKSLVKTETDHPYIRVADMFQGGVSLAEIMYVPDEVFPAIKNYRIYIDDIFISVAGTLGVIGKTPKELNGANLTENADRLTNITCDKEYLLYVLMSWLIQNKIEAEKTFGAQPKLALTRIRKFSIPLPPTLTEQTAIATTLNDADALITQLEKLVAKKRAIKQGAMQKCLNPDFYDFYDEPHLTDGEKSKKSLNQKNHSSDKWEVKKLGEVATLKARIGWQGLTTAEYRKSGDYFLITGTEFKNGFIDWESCFYVGAVRYKQDKNIQVKVQDVLVTKDGTIGKVALIKSVPKPATLNSGVFVIRPTNNSFHPEFFYYLLLSEVFLIFLSQLSAGSTIIHLYQKDFVTFKFSTPKTLEEQTRIAQILSDMDAEIEVLEKKLEKYKKIKHGMMQELLTGRIRLV